MSNTRWVTQLVTATFFCCHILLSLACGTQTQGSGGGTNGAPDAGPEPPDASDDWTLPGDDGGNTFLLDAAGSNAPDVCVPATGCPADVQCGRYVDCTGNVFACGTPCPSGQACIAAAQGGQSCQAKPCAGKCGVVGVDSCGAAIGCGGCSASQDCVANQCVPHGSAQVDAGPADACPPLACDSAGAQLCGTIHDSCGNSMQCSCPAGLQCSSGICSKPAPECSSSSAAKCGTVTNACGSGQVSCAACSGSNKCVNGTCTACSPPACGSAVCGSMSNGCGPAVSCGTCTGSEVCEDGGCCTPKTCAMALEGGLVTGCGMVDLGCGIKKPCQPCGAGETCVNSACQVCTPKTCADFGNTGCGHSDGCGKTIDCCGSGLACQGGICCQAGEVNYNGSCCLPGCDQDLPAGPQVSCGQLILCTGPGGGGSSSGGTSSGGAK